MKLKDLKLLSKDALIYGIGNASNRFIRVMLAPLYAAYLSVDRYGIRAMTVALYGFLQIFILLAINEAVIADYYKAKTDTERRNVISTGFLFSMITALLAGGLLFITAHFLPQVLDILGRNPTAGVMGLELPEAQHIFKLFAVYTALTPPMFVFLSMLRSEKKPLAYGIFSVATSLVRVGLMVIFFVVLGRELKGIYEVDAMMAVAVLCVTAIWVFTYSKGVKFSGRHLKSMLSYSAPLILTSAFFWGREMLDRFLIPIYLTQTDVGVFAFARNFPNIVSFLLITPLSLAWVPYAFSIKDKPDFPEILSRILTYILFLAGWMLVVLGGCAQEILKLIAKRPSYWAGAPYIPLLIVALSLFAANKIISTVFHVKRKTIYITLTAFISTAVVIGLNVFLLPVIGLYASALAPVIGYGSALVATVLLVRRLLEVKYENKRIALVSLIPVTLTAILFFWHPFAPLLGFIFKLGIGSLGYFLLLLISGFLLPSEWEFIKKKFRRRK